MKTLLLMPLTIGVWEWVIIALVILLLFGGKKIPELMRGLGKGMKSFKQGMKEVEADVNEIKKDIESEE
jgi:sec-independent protein translocase protein TatA